MRRPLIAVALLLLAPLANAQFYKWTDSSGTVHYSQEAPPAGTRHQQVKITGSTTALATPAEPAEQPSAASTAPATHPMADTPENRNKLCATLQANLDMLKGNDPLVTQDGKQQKLMDTAGRKQQKATAEAQYQQFCAR
ncbi:DUF4124 domain-containing protein [Dyella tabacisoli]|uniref:DUF4124 domain-containing protein n=1 Tax=Dyella tabacisoli TaxID=2282381 RepID=A0A369UTC4_9GAMM|nr:DUF4124 domain-containing protein [Dyella tabacisoli]RDD82958.1 DUF4124 domain-containing protein [Dyella tabacisoli]